MIFPIERYAAFINQSCVIISTTIQYIGYRRLNDESSEDASANQLKRRTLRDVIGLACSASCVILFEMLETTQHE